MKNIVRTFQNFTCARLLTLKLLRNAIFKTFFKTPKLSNLCRKVLVLYISYILLHMWGRDEREVRCTTWAKRKALSLKPYSFWSLCGLGSQASKDIHKFPAILYIATIHSHFPILNSWEHQTTMTVTINHFKLILIERRNVLNHWL